MVSNKQLHSLFVIFFAAISVFLTLGRVGTAFNSFALLTPDLGVYASIAAGQEHPDLFPGDPFISNPKNINSYNMLYVPLIKALKNILGNYGAACAFLLPFFIFIHLLGYYVLGVSIFKNPWAGLFIALLISAPINTYYDFWGLILDSLPRFLYQGVLPFLLALSIVRGNNPRWWPVIMAGLGILNYVHPLSTPTWIIAFALALWVSVSGISFWERVRLLGVAILVLVIILIPFLVNYAGSTASGTKEVVYYDQTLAILQSRFSSMSTTSLSAFLLNFFVGQQGVISNFIWYLVCALAVVGVAYGLTAPKTSMEYAHMRQVAAWMAGIFIGSGLLPVLEQAVFAYLKQIPPEFELARTIRYMIPLILLSAFSALWMAKGELQNKNVLTLPFSRNIFIALSTLLLVAWGLRGEAQRPEFRGVVRQNIRCWLQVKLVCSLRPGSMDFIDMLDVVRHETPIGSRVFSEGQEVAVRYYALRPLVYTYKDGAPLAYTNPEQLLKWRDRYDVMNRLAYIRRFPFRRKGFMKDIVELAKNAKAEYLILSEPYKENLFYPKALILIYSNDNYSLYKINP